MTKSTSAKSGSNSVGCLEKDHPNGKYPSLVDIDAPSELDKANHTNNIGTKNGRESLQSRSFLTFF